MKGIKWIIIIVIVILCIGSSIWYLRHTPPKSSETQETKESLVAPEEEGPVARVKVIPLKESRIEESVTLYGTIVAVSQQVKSYSVPFESQIKQIKVTLGQTVHKGDLLVSIEPTLAEKLELKQARSDVQATQEILKKLNEKLQLKLTTRQEVLQAQQAVDQAKLKLENLLQEGIETLREIKAGEDGIINQLDIQNAQVIPGNTILVGILINNSLEARLGIDPVNVKDMKVGQTVFLTIVNRPSSGEVKGTIRLFTHKINPDTRLLDILVSLPSKHPFLLSDYIQGKIAVRGAKGFVVPREAVLPNDKGNTMYTIESGKAVLHQVLLGLETENEVQVIEKGLTMGVPVVIQGNYELKDGMAVDTTDTK